MSSRYLNTINKRFKDIFNWDLGVFRFYKPKPLYTLDEIRLWLTAYYDCYAKMEREGKYGLFSYLKPDREFIFFELYRTLDEISEYNRDEEYFKEEVYNYYKIKDSKIEVEKWIKRNEKLGSEKYICFLPNHFYFSQDKTEHLNIPFSYFKSFDINIDKKDYKYTMEFLEIFKELYWY